MKIPQALLDSLQDVKGFNQATFIQSLEQEESPISIRVNPFKKIDRFDNAEPVIWSEFGKYLPNRSNFTLDPLFHAGTYFVQEASSMYLEHILKKTVDLKQDLKVLDLCASPGGSSTLIASILSPGSLLVSNDAIQTRANILSDNLTKWGTMNTVVTNNDPKDFMRLSGFFDVLVIDAPSSDSGLFRRKNEAIKEWSLEHVITCSLRQKKIINDAWACLKQGGIFIYSTCSYSKAENEDIVNWIQEVFNAEPLITTEKGIGAEVISDNSFRFYPDQIKGEGFFITAFQKKSSEKEVFIRSGKPIKNNNRRTEREIFRNWVEDIDEHTWFEKNDDYFLINPIQEHTIHLLQSYLSVKKVGIRLGKLSSKDLIPEHELAMSLNISQQISQIELTMDQAVSYLRKDDFSLNQTEKGWSLMTFEGFGLGWAKVLPNRINNYYPKELKILGK